MDSKANKQINLLGHLLRRGKIDNKMFNENQSKILGGVNDIPPVIAERANNFVENVPQSPYKASSTLSNVVDDMNLNKRIDEGMRKKLPVSGRLNALGALGAVASVTPAAKDISEGNINQAVNKLTIDSLPGENSELNQLKEHFRNQAEEADMSPEEKAKRDYLQALRSGRAG